MISGNYNNNINNLNINNINNTKSRNIPGFGRICSPFGGIVSSLAVAIIMAGGPLTSLQAQETLQPQFTQPGWWFGGAAAANYNFFTGSTQHLNAGLTPPVAFHKGKGTGLYLAPLVEYRRPGSKWGVMLQTGYDSRRGSFETQTTPCNCPADLTTRLGYITVEPGLRFSPFKSGFYVMAGPRMAFNINKSFTYQLGTNPDFTDQPISEPVNGDFDNVNKVLLSMQFGAGYDIPLLAEEKQNQVILSPFIAFQPYFGQSPRSLDTWSVSTLRTGVAIKLGRGKLIPAKALSTASVQFTVNSPENIPVNRRVRETFPLRNYVFFDQGSNEIPERYVTLRPDQVKEFKEDQLEVFTPKELSGRSDREMTVYYNVINILGDRMGRNPSSTITLVGSSENGPQEGKAMAEKIKTYLVNIFAIDASRISITGRDKPKLPSGKPDGTKELDLLREDDRRVSVESSSTALLMEFQSGPDAPLKPVKFTAVQQAPPDSYLTFTAAGADKAFSLWSLEVMDEDGKVQYFGPYFQETVSLPGKTILGNRPKGTYKVTMVGNGRKGSELRQEKIVNMVLWTPDKDEEGLRYSVIYEFNESKATGTYEKYLKDIVAPEIPENGTVIIHGHTDIIGEEASNQQLSLARANNVKEILESSLSGTGRKDVNFKVTGFGEDQFASPFGNKYPEERFYNRTVIIDIIPAK